MGMWHKALELVSSGKAGWDAELDFRLAQISYLAVRKLIFLCPDPDCKIQFQMPSVSHGFSVMHMRCFNITDKSQSILKQTTGHCLCKNWHEW